MKTGRMEPRYTAAARYLHWAVAGLIALQFVLAKWAESAQHADRDLQALALLANHKSVGMTVLVLALLRVTWRWWNPPPPLPETIPRLQVRAAHGAHWLLYGLLFAMPLTGWLMSSASAYSVSWFNLFTFPDLIGRDPDVKETFEAVHETLSQVLLVVVLGHIAAALWHQLRNRDGVLWRMTTPAPVLVGAGLTVAGVVLVAGLTGGTTSPAATQDQSRPEAAPTGAAQQTSTLPAWQIDYGRSHIRFSAQQAGAPFSGHFAAWQGDVRFDPALLGDGVATVTVDLASVDTGDAERDGTLGQPEWFGERRARFRASRFEVLDDGRFRTADATLDFGHGAHPVTLTFAVERNGPRLVLDGAASLDRTALQVGTGDWRDTTWVGQFVEVTVHVEADTAH